MNQHKISVIGAGNLGISIVEGLLKAGYSPEKIWATRRDLTHIEALGKSGVNITTDNSEAVKNTDIIILSVKPFQVKEVVESISKDLEGEKVLVSTATGISLNELLQMAGDNKQVIRAMPNTAIAIQESMTCICGVNADGNMTEVKNIFDHLGTTLEINEELMDAATVLAACGIAYCLRFIRAASQGGIEIGFHSEEAQLIAAQTAKGAASLLLERNQHPENEIDKVTTPKGCTIAGLNEMEHQGFSSSLIKGILTSFQKI